MINILGQPAIWQLNSNYFENGLKFVDFNPIVEFLTSKFKIFMNTFILVIYFNNLFRYVNHFFICVV